MRQTANQETISLNGASTPVLSIPKKAETTEKRKWVKPEMVNLIINNSKDTTDDDMMYKC